MKADACPVLYSFRRCPYAMRARMALLVNDTTCEIREVDLKDKPDGMLAASTKATVPVLILTDGQVIDQSLDIMLWALERDDPQGWLWPEAGTLADMLALIDQTEHPFKTHLDRYKYAARHDDADPQFHRDEGLKFLGLLDDRLQAMSHLFGNRPALADIAIFPFIRQFANTDRNWFDEQDLPALQAWLDGHLSSPLFENTMTKRPFWSTTDTPTYLAAAVDG